MFRRMPTLLAALALSAPAFSATSETQVLPLSGMGEAGEAPVYWDFKLDAGRGSVAGNGKWARIAVPSCWEQQGFGDVVVWNPGAEGAAVLTDLDAGEHARFVCVEAACVAHPVELPAGGIWEGSQTLTALDPTTPDAPLG